MSDPILRVRLTIKRSILYVYISVRLIEVNIANSSSSVGELIGDGDGFKERWCDEVHVLTRIGEKAHHAKESEAGHGAGIVVAG
jgi:flagellin-specific chaperone FliS